LPGFGARIAARIAGRIAGRKFPPETDKDFSIFRNIPIFAVPFVRKPFSDREISHGEVLEWLKRHAWKACRLLKGLPSSNLGLSAENRFIHWHEAIF
jgi:hypothetical protein